MPTENGSFKQPPFSRNLEKQQMLLGLRSGVWCLDCFLLGALGSWLSMSGIGPWEAFPLQAGGFGGGGMGVGNPLLAILGAVTVARSIYPC